MVELDGVMHQSKINIIKHSDGVYEFKDFLPEEIRIGLLKKAEVDKDWRTLYKGNTVKNMTSDLWSKMKIVYKNIETFFTNVHLIDPSSNLRRLQFEEFMRPHVDGSGYKDPENNKKIAFGVAIYLNDNFEGGELIYPEIGLVVTPKAGSMIIHDASLKHQVFPVCSGERYSITTFIFGDDTTKFKESLLIEGSLS